MPHAYDHLLQQLLWIYVLEHLCLLDIIICFNASSKSVCMYAVSELSVRGLAPLCKVAQKMNRHGLMERQVLNEPVFRVGRDLDARVLSSTNSFLFTVC